MPTTSVAVRLWAPGQPILTTNHVVGETWTFLRRRDGHPSAVAFLDAVEAADWLTVVHVEEATEREARAWLRRHDERVYSFVDATSFAVMRRERLAGGVGIRRRLQRGGLRRGSTDGLIGRGSPLAQRRICGRQRPPAARTPSEQPRSCAYARTQELVGARDGDPDTSGIRAVESCRARHVTASGSASANPLRLRLAFYPPAVSTCGAALGAPGFDGHYPSWSRRRVR